MKIKSLFVVVLLIFGIAIVPASGADEAAVFQKPKMATFEFSPKELDLRNGSQDINIQVTVSHPVGILSKQMVVRLAKVSNSTSVFFQTILTRVDSPIIANLKLVTFVGKINIPTSTPSGVWTLTADPVLGISPSGSEGWYSDIFAPNNFREFPGAENSLLIRLNGELDFDFQTFVGPFYATEKYATDGQSVITPLTVSPPIFRVGETLDINDYTQKRAPEIQLSVESLSPEICSAAGSVLTFREIGFCQYKIYSFKTSNYRYKELVTGNEVKAKRFKPQIYPPTIERQIVKTFPATISREPVYSWYELLQPYSQTPTICVATGGEIRLFSSGVCNLTYFIPATEARLSSDVVTQSFRVLKEGELEVVPTPVPTPTATPTPTAKPVVKKTITCVKGKKTIKKTAISPKCPAGYKLKK